MIHIWLSPDGRTYVIDSIVAARSRRRRSATHPDGNAERAGLRGAARSPASKSTPAAATTRSSSPATIPIPVTMRGGAGRRRRWSAARGADKLIGGAGDDTPRSAAAATTRSSAAPATTGCSAAPATTSLRGGPGDDVLDRRLRRQRRPPASSAAALRRAAARAPASRAPSRRPPTKRSAIRKPTSESAASSRKAAWMPSTKGGICGREDGRGQAQADRAAGDLEHVDDAAGEAGLRFVDRGDPGGGRGRVEAADPDPEHDHADDQRAVARAGVDQREEERRDGDAGGAEDRQRLGAEPVVERPGDEGDERRRWPRKGSIPTPGFQRRVAELFLHELRQVEQRGEEGRRHEEDRQAGGA